MLSNVDLSLHKFNMHHVTSMLPLAAITALACIKEYIALADVTSTTPSMIQQLLAVVPFPPADAKQHGDACFL